MTLHRQHSRTVGDYARLVAVALDLCPEHVERIHAAGVLHDLGKLGLAGAILFKPGLLDSIGSWSTSWSTPSSRRSAGAANSAPTRSAAPPSLSEAADTIG